MPKVTFSITSTRGTASVTLYDAASAHLGSILLNNSFKEALPITTTVGRTIVGSSVVTGSQVEGPLVWPGVEALLTEIDYLTLKAAAMKSDLGRRSGGTIEIVMGDEFYPYVEDAATNSRALATGSTTAIASTGSIWYYAAYNVAILNFETISTNLRLNNGQGFGVSFDIVELDKRTP